LAPREEAGGNLLLAVAAEKVHTLEGRDVVVITKETMKEAITAEIEDKDLDKTNTV
jgi:hypothetical protein